MANTIEIVIKSKGDSAIKGISSVNKALSNVGKSLSGVGDTLTRNVTRPIAAVGVALGGLGAISVATAVSFESAFAGVIKTTDGLIDSTGELTAVGAELERGFRDLAKTIPVSVEELLKIGELGGQLGIARESLLDFTETVAALGVTTNLSTEEAAAGFAQLANIMQTPQDQIENMGSAIVELGNNFATTERDILGFAQRIAGAGRIAGITESDVFGIAAAFSSVGIEAEAGGTAVQKVLIGINEAVITSSEELAVFATTAGMSADQFTTAWETDAAGAFAQFVVGLGRAGDDAITILQDLGLEDQRLVRAFLSLANAGELLPRALELSSAAYIENIALTKEAETRYRTFESRLTIFKNALRDVGITIGDALLPFLEELLEDTKPLIDDLGQTLPDFLSNSLQPAIRNVLAALKPFAEMIIGLTKAFADLSPATQQNIIKIALLAAAAGPAFKILGAGVTTIGALAGVFGKLPVLIAGATAALNAWRAGLTLTTALGAAGLSPIAITLGAIGVAAGAVVAVWAQWNKQIVQTNKEGQKAVSSAWEDFFKKQVESGADATKIAEEYRMAQDRVKQSLEDANPILRLFIADQDKLLGNTGMANAALADAADTFGEYVQAANIAGIGIDKLTEEQFNQIKAAMKQENVTEDVIEELEGYSEEVLQAAGVTTEFTEATEEVAESLLKASEVASIIKDSFANAGIEGAAMSGIMDQLGVALGEVTQEQINAAGRVRLLADAYANGVISLGDFTRYTAQAAEGTLELSGLQLGAIERATNYQAALRANAKAAQELSLRQMELAESLKNATNAQIAQAAISELQRAFESGQISFETYATAVTEVQETFGLVNEKSRALSEGITLITGALTEGTLPAESFDEALKFIIADSANGAINMEALLEKFGVVPESMGAAEESMSTARGEMGMLGEDSIVIAKQIENAFTTPNWTGMGTDISGGIADGITAGTPAIEAAARAAARAALGAAKEELQVRSPSKKFMEVGLNITAGLTQGILAGVSKVTNAVQGFTSTLIGAVQQQRFAMAAAPTGSFRSGSGQPFSTSTSNTSVGGDTINNNFFNQGATALALAAQEERRRSRLKRSIGMRG